jgi:hypothetical protein
VARKKSSLRQQIKWGDFLRLVNSLETHPLFSFEIVNDSGKVVTLIIGEKELKREAFSGITLSDIEKFFEKHEADFKEAQTLIAKFRKSKESLKQSKKELAEAKRRQAKFREVTEKVKERVYGKSGKKLADLLFEEAKKLEKNMARRKEHGFFDREEDREKLEKWREELKARRAREDREDLAAAQKAIKEKGSISLKKLKTELEKKDARPKKRSNKKG